MTSTFSPQEIHLLNAFVKAHKDGRLEVPFPTKGHAIQYRQKCYAIRRKALAKIEKGFLGQEYAEKMLEVLIQLQELPAGSGRWGLIFNRADNTVGAQALKAALGDEIIDFNALGDEGMQDSFQKRLAEEGMLAGAGGIPSVESRNEPDIPRPANPYFTRQR